jgi:hypothetical protein
MDYPLGSFPRFGHQERWARERRERAISNSITTRRWNACWRRHRKAEQPCVIHDRGNTIAAEYARTTLIRLGNAALDWIAFISRVNHRVKAEATVARQLSEKAAEIHREFERMVADFEGIPVPVGGREWIQEINRLEGLYRDFGPKVQDLKLRLSEARIGPVRMLWMSLNSRIRDDSGADPSTRPPP